VKLKYIVEDDFRSLAIRSGVVAEMTGMRIEQSHPDLERTKEGAILRLTRMSEVSIRENPVLQGYRDLVRSVGRSPKKFPPAAESLIGQIRRTLRFPSINVAVDCYNVVVTDRFLAFGVHDMAKVGQTIRFRFSSGGESFLAVGSEHAKMTQRGDYVYADDGQVLAWLDSKDSDKVKVSLQTTDLIIVVQGTDRTERAYIEEAIGQACELIKRFCGGNYEMAPID
jgi:DNA/RNA-binding domain of Phe-tRNA-synthetase-like protein